MNNLLTKNLLGHEKTLAELFALQDKNRLPHALLFVGPDGIGKRGAALALTRRLLCENKTHCRQCRSCQNKDLSTHPDLQILEPENGRIKIDAIREIRRSLNFPPFLSQSRVVIFIDAHSMNNAASNALLKTLEEPPSDTYFILVSHAPGWIPRTIVSRCQKVTFSPLNDTQLETLVRQHAPADISISKILLHAAQGSVRRALDLLNMTEVPQLDELFPGKNALRFPQAHELAQRITEEERVLPFLEYLLSMIHLRLTQQYQGDNLDFELLAFADRIFEIRKALRLNANPRIHLARLLMFFQESLATRL